MSKYITASDEFYLAFPKLVQVTKKFLNKNKHM